MVSIPPGTFNMGDPAHFAMTPVHAVSISYRYAIAETEITGAQFSYFVGRTGYTGGGVTAAATDPRKPVTGIDWFAALAYVRWLSRHTGQGYRLPSEAEWEYAARAGTRTRYWWGDAKDGACGNEHVSALFFGLQGMTCESNTDTGLQAAGSKHANPWGLFDMLGNADEWLADCPAIDVMGYAGAPADGAPDMRCSSYSDRRVVRRSGDYSGAIAREKLDPYTQAPTIGFRVVRELK